MSVAATIVRYLNDQQVAFDVVKHRDTGSARASARTSHIPDERLAKAVVLRDHHGFWVAVLPASSRIELGKVAALLSEPVDLANEEQVEPLFSDCLPGAVPALGTAYGLKTIVDDSLGEQSDVYFEGGDHQSLVHVSGPNFRKLMAGARHGRFAEPTVPWT
ncbi:MAG TPA: YbaK/EbsC family protein [Alphaproteobacteria bacterium]|nr:YbaK/EbsC family protein [Alphaproteobacteria bacterium]